MTIDETVYDPHAEGCICPDCDNDAGASSEMCANCEYYSCTDRKERCG